MNPLNVPHKYFICTAEQCRSMDEQTIDDFGIDGFTLMEIAGSSASRHLLSTIDDHSEGVYLCGKGNNAGDALVAARYLIQHGHSATIVFLSGTGDLSEDCGKNLKLLTKISDNDPDSADLRIYESWKDFDRNTTCNFIIDGMLGTGLDSALRGDYREAVGWANELEKPTYAIDIPTGLHADTGHVMGEAIRADCTYTFGARKLGFYLNEGFSYTGSVHYCELPFPNYTKQSCSSFLIDRSWVQPVSRKPAKHKYDAGVLYIVAGSEGLTGAAILAAESAWAEGLGAVILVTPRGNLDIFEKNLPQIIKKPVGSKDDYCFKSEHADRVLKILEEKEENVLFGPGLGREDTTREFTRQIIESFRGNMIIDADGLWCLAQFDDWNKPADSHWILTPHPGELSKLLDTDLRDDYDRIQALNSFSRDKEITVISKGFPVIIGTPEENSYLTGYDTRRFSRAGFGDVLAGKAAAYWSLGRSAVHSGALALLDGKEKVDIMEKKNRDVKPEPKDLI